MAFKLMIILLTIQELNRLHFDCQVNYSEPKPELECGPTKGDQIVSVYKELFHTVGLK